jgi:hypothetical protein
MARTKNPLWVGSKGTSGSVGKQIVFKQYEDKTVITKYPDMSNVVLTPAQIKENNRFAEAIKYAKDIISDPVKKAAYPVRKGKSVYQSAIKDFLNKDR